MSALGGALLRGEDGAWRWRDGSPEPRCADAHPSWFYNFRVRGSTVEVPVQAMYEDHDLAWIRDWHARGELRTGLDGDRTARAALAEAMGRRGHRVVLVPLDAWDAWSSATVIGPRWDQAHEADIFSRAAALGWVRP